MLAKEHIDAAAAPVASDAQAQSTKREATIAQDKSTDGETITVDSYVMKPEARGTSRDARALQQEQWLVKVRMIENGRMFKVPVDRRQFEQLTPGDRVRARYEVGRYTGTVWGARIEG